VATCHRHAITLGTPRSMLDGMRLRLCR
jgi:hypothetical protein